MVSRELEWKTDFLRLDGGRDVRLKRVCCDCYLTHRPSLDEGNKGRVSFQLKGLEGQDFHVA